MPQPRLGRGRGVAGSTAAPASREGALSDGDARTRPARPSDLRHRPRRVGSGWRRLGRELEGLTRHIGVSNFDRPLIERCLPIRHVDSVQNECSLLHRDDVAGLLPWLAEQGIGYLAYGPLGFGLLTGAIGPDTPLDEH